MQECTNFLFLTFAGDSDTLGAINLRLDVKGRKEAD